MNPNSGGNPVKNAKRPLLPSEPRASCFLGAEDFGYPCRRLRKLTRPPLVLCRCRCHLACTLTGLLGVSHFHRRPPAVAVTRLRASALGAEDSARLLCRMAGR